MKLHVNITIDEDLLHAIDELRGYEPRSSFINRLLRKALFGEEDVG